MNGINYDILHSSRVGLCIAQFRWRRTIHVDLMLLILGSLRSALFPVELDICWASVICPAIDTSSFLLDKLLRRPPARTVGTITNQIAISLCHGITNDTRHLLRYLVMNEYQLVVSLEGHTSMAHLGFSQRLVNQNCCFLYDNFEIVILFYRGKVYSVDVHPQRSMFIEARRPTVELMPAMNLSFTFVQRNWSDSNVQPSNIGPHLDLRMFVPLFVILVVALDVRLIARGYANREKRLEVWSDPSRLKHWQDVFEPCESPQTVHVVGAGISVLVTILTSDPLYFFLAMIPASFYEARLAAPIRVPWISWLHFVFLGLLSVYTFSVWQYPDMFTLSILDLELLFGAVLLLIPLIKRSGVFWNVTTKPRVKPDVSIVGGNVGSCPSVLFFLAAAFSITFAVLPLQWTMMEQVVYGSEFPRSVLILFVASVFLVTAVLSGSLFVVQFVEFATTSRSLTVTIAAGFSAPFCASTVCFFWPRMIRTYDSFMIHSELIGFAVIGVFCVTAAAAHVGWRLRAHSLRREIGCSLQHMQGTPTHFVIAS
jgi:hypothetical protein